MAKPHNDMFSFLLILIARSFWLRKKKLVWRWSEKFSLILSLNEQRSEGIQNRSCEQIWGSWNTVWSLKCFNVLQTLKLVWTNKLCLDVKTFCGDMCFWSFLWSWPKDVNMRLRICFVSRSDTSTRNIATWAETSLFVCCKSGWTLGSIDLVCVDALLFLLRKTSWTLTPGGSRGFVEA